MSDINFNLYDQNNLDMHKFLFNFLVMLISEKSTYRSYSRRNHNDMLNRHDNLTGCGRNMQKLEMKPLLWEIISFLLWY